MMKNSYRSVLLTTLAGVQNAHLDGDFVVGNWKSKRERGYVTNRPLRRGVPSLVEDFVNIRPDPKEILRFTLKYAPLSPYPESSSLEFRQSLKEWRDFQGWLRYLWSLGVSTAASGPMHTGDSIYFDRAGRVSKISLYSLRWFLEFSITSIPGARRRICARPGCGTYFIAERKDSNYCDTPLCVKLVQKQYKSDWWKEHGETWRQDHAAKKAKKHRKAQKSGRRKR
jgi:hypothetical protein